MIIGRDTSEGVCDMPEVNGVICADRPDADRMIVDRVLGDAHAILDDRARTSPADFAVDGLAFEHLAYEALTASASGTILEGNIELISGHSFPDVVVRINNGAYGIEVKSTTQNHWSTMGNSVIESTRIKDINRVYILFGKLCDPIGFKIRPYEDCLSEVKVTHSPRYQIDMDLQDGETIFDKIGMTYDAVRNQGNPALPFVQYYKSQLRPGESLWWAGDSAENGSVPVTMRLWNNLSIEAREEYIVKALVRFPELWSNSPTKYSNFLLWLVREYGVVCGNVRDGFSAGGTVGYEFDGQEVVGLRHVVKSLLDRRWEFADELLQLSDQEILSYWHVNPRMCGDRKVFWLDNLVRNNLSDEEYCLIYHALHGGGFREITLRGRGLR